MQSQNGFRKDSQKDVTKSLNKSGQIGVATKNTATLLGSVGMETLVATKIAMPKISVVRR